LDGQLGTVIGVAHYDPLTYHVMVWTTRRAIPAALLTLVRRASPPKDADHGLAQINAQEVSPHE
jgi:hypothetical protein